MELRCKRCGSAKQVKNGLMRGKQRYLCKDCGLTFTDTPPRGKPLALKAAAVLLYVSGLSMNRTAKLLGVSTPTIQAWLEQFAAAFAQKPEPEGRAVVIELDEMWHDLKKLRRQSELYGLAFQVGEIGLGVSAEATLERASLAPLVEASADRLPARAIDAPQIACARRRQPGRRARNQAHRAAHHGPGRGGLATAGPTLGIAARAEELLETIVGARQIRHCIAVEQPGPI